MSDYSSKPSWRVEYKQFNPYTGKTFETALHCMAWDREDAIEQAFYHAARHDPAAHDPVIISAEFFGSGDDETEEE